MPTGIPIAYPRMVFLENALSSKFSPFVALGRLGIEGFVNRFNGDAELLDDLVLIFIFFSRLHSELIVYFLKKNDHWTSTHHKVLILHLTTIFGSLDFARQSAIGSLNDFNDLP
jgi:hypothetical protein